MSLTASDVGSIANSLSYWEDAEYICAGLVTIACFGEFVADFTDWFTKGIEERKKLVARLSTVLLIGSLALELVCLVKTNQLSGRIIGSLDEKATDAVDKSQKALAQSDTAIKSSGEAEASSRRAIDNSGNALSLANGARKEADSFEKDINLARQQATDALANLAEAKRLAEEAQKGTAVLAQAALPRRLSEEQKVELIRLLSAVPAFTVVFENTRSLSDEVLNFTDDFMDVFIRMKLIPADSSSRKLRRAIAAPEGHGVIVVVMGVEQTDHPLAADVLINTLRGWGFEASGEAAQNIAKSATEIHILVGAKQ